MGVHSCVSQRANSFGLAGSGDVYLLPVNTRQVPTSEGMSVYHCNGTTDSSSELFGIDTIKSNNTFATQGFETLKDLDSNLDGFITAADTAFAELKVWQDLNQVGISQAGELKTLSHWSIPNIEVNRKSTGPKAGRVFAGN